MITIIFGIILPDVFCMIATLGDNEISVELFNPRDDLCSEIHKQKFRRKLGNIKRR